MLLDTSYIPTTVVGSPIQRRNQCLASRLFYLIWRLVRDVLTLRIDHRQCPTVGSRWIVHRVIAPQKIVSVLLCLAQSLLNLPFARYRRPVWIILNKLRIHREILLTTPA